MGWLGTAEPLVGDELQAVVVRRRLRRWCRSLPPEAAHPRAPRLGPASASRPALEDTAVMTLPQFFAFGIVATMMALFVWGRLRYDLVAMLALLSAVATGIVPPDRAFRGFGDDIVIIVATALLVSAAVARSGITERLMAPLAPHLTTVRRQVVVLVGAVTVLSAFVKNVGALAILMPIVFQQARRAGTPASAVLMPLAFGSLLGGLLTLIGTSPNVIVSRVRAELLGEPFRMFDFMPVGAGIALAGITFLAFGYRLLPGGRKGSGTAEVSFRIEDYSTEATLPATSPLAGKTVAELESGPSQ